MLGVQLETVVVDGMNSFLIIVFFVVSSQRKKIEKGVSPFSILILFYV